MQGVSNIALPFPLPVLILISVISSLAGILVAFDARERGMSKFTAIAWFFGIQLFPPIVIMYLFMRWLESRLLSGMRPPGVPPPPSGSTGAQPPESSQSSHKYCPYCAAPLSGNEKICQGCGRLL